MEESRNRRRWWKMLFITTKAAKLKLNYSELYLAVVCRRVEPTRIKTFLCCFMWKNSYYFFFKSKEITGNPENFNPNICMCVCASKKNLPSLHQTILAQHTHTHICIYAYLLRDWDKQRRKKWMLYCLPKETEINLNNKHVSWVLWWWWAAANVSVCRRKREEERNVNKLSQRFIFKKTY